MISQIIILRATALGVTFLCLISANAIAADSSSVEWPYYGNDPGGQRYAPLNQINRGNVSQLKVVWTYHTGETSNGQTNPHVANGKWRFNKTGFEDTPIVVDGMMYISTPFCRVVALDPTTGAEKWTFDPQSRSLIMARPSTQTRRGMPAQNLHRHYRCTPDRARCR
jgi:quinoprotein glucose dehydrogenase